MAGVEKAGAVYRCQTDPPHHCEQIPFDTSGKIAMKIYLVNVLRNGRKNKEIEINRRK